MVNDELPPAASTHSESGRMRVASWVKIGVPALVLAGVAVGVLLGTGNRTDGAPGYNSTPTASDTFTPGPSPTDTGEVVIPSPSPSPSPTETAPDGPPMFDVDVGITVEQYTTPDAVAEAFVQAGTAWMNAGATPENREIAFTEQGGGAEVYAVTLADRNRTDFINAFLPADWESNDSLRTLVEKAYDANVATLVFYFYTGEVFGSRNPGDVEPYHRSTVLVGDGNIESHQPDANTLVITFD